MPWIQISFHIHSQFVEDLSTALQTLGALSITLQDDKDQPIFEPPPGEIPLWPDTKLSALFSGDSNIHQITNQLSLTLDLETLPRYEIETLEDRDWERECMKDFAPLQFGSRLCICPSWCEPPNPDAVTVQLDPGLAFGTGTHATTALCLEWLEQHIRSTHSVVDFGCGSGILAIAAAKLGANKVWAIDNDPQAVEATLNNAQQNDVARYVSVTLSDNTRNLMPVDIVIANILSQPLINLSKSLSDMVKPTGHIVLSGILKQQVEDVCNHYDLWFDFNPPHERDGWIRLDGQKRQ